MPRLVDLPGAQAMMSRLIDNQGGFDGMILLIDPG